MLAMMQDLVFPDPPLANEAPPEEAHVQQAANATIGTDVQLQMLQILQAMQATHATGNQQGQQQSQRQGQQGGNGNRNRTNRRTPDDASFNRVDKSKYCHTHGACNHRSSACNKKAPGHKDNATLPHRM